MFLLHTTCFQNMHEIWISWLTQEAVHQVLPVYHYANIILKWVCHALFNKAHGFTYVVNHFQYTWWHQDMDILFTLLILCAENPSVTSGFSVHWAGDAYQLWSMYCKPEWFPADSFKWSKMPRLSCDFTNYHDSPKGRIFQCLICNAIFLFVNFQHFVVPLDKF